MIKSITLKCFRKHLDLTVNLTEGLQTFRGANEAGKTTLLEGAAYALFGSKVLRDPFSDVVTWDCKESELHASTVLAMNGTDYTFNRCKAGAEVVVDGKPFVTGQNEVSAFAADLLGADANVASHLMLANQGGLRGVLEQGPKATSNLIETLSDLDIIDRIVEAAQAKLQLGSTAVQEDRLKAADLALATFVEPVEPVAPDLAAMQASIAEKEAAVVTATGVRDAAQAAYTVEFDKRTKAAELERDRVQVLAQAEETALQVADEKVKAESVVADPAPIKAALVAAEDSDNRTKAWGAFSKVVEPSLRMPAATWNALGARLQADLAGIKNRITEHSATIRVLEPQVATSHNCPACGQDTAHLEHVKAKQVQVQADLARAREELVLAQSALPEAQENVDEIEQLIQLHHANLQLVSKISGYVTITENVFPAIITWNGDPVVPGDRIDAAALRRQLNEIEATLSARSKAQAKVEALTDVLAGCTRRTAAIQAAIKDLDLASDDAYAGLSATFSESALAQTEVEGSLAIAKFALEGVEGEYKAAKLAFDTAKAQGVALAATVATLKADIETVQFNNGLVKKVRAARPIIANKLWNLVLSTVSTLFTQMRGEVSVVTKVGDKFLVNGRSSSQSGSTIDILGLAIRCALVKTFVPNCPFLVLDEPAAAMDDNREAVMLGYVAAAGFQQVILVTHSDQADALSSTLIQL